MALAVMFAVLAAAANATASVLQRKAARREPDRGGLSLRMLLDLARQPAWIGGIITILLGFALQAAALAAGPILLVQPILILEVGFTLLLSTLVFRSRLHVREWVAVLGMSAGVALLLVAFAPRGGDTRNAPTAAWILGSVVTVMVAGLLTLFGHRSRDARRAAFLGVAAGIWFGFTAALVAGVMAALAGGIGALAGTWQLYALVVAGPLGFFQLQNALRAGRLVASQPGLTLANPVASVGWGIAVFGDQVRGGAWIIAEVAGAAAVAVCTVLLARSPLLQGEQGRSEQDASPGQERAAR
ncbi:DMT family transporter [Amycolatopsis sp. K13G38]|uniref:DMT family transporter n=1 Tax=Amycolatopsis acididurans TaxID=2724524 RepID=A0ABX1J5W6_9PSEU|nr:DMT family transporter [Amycolatopsis acididurans]NKQ54324.1 DMT family transporter [Amycolatopsis acididurans]